MPRSLGKWIFRGAISSAGGIPGIKPAKERAMTDPKPKGDPSPVGDPKPGRDPKPQGDPNPTAPGREIGDRPGNAGQHPGTPPAVDARKSSGKGSQSLSARRPTKQPINDRNTAGDRGAREPVSR
jgi:hypothetical protein